MIKIYAPASIGNVGVGFDILGAAIIPINGSLLGDFVTVKLSNKFNLVNKGIFSNKLPKNTEQNIVWKCWLKFCNTIKRNIPVSIILEKNMPIGSGLGSSACSIVATLVAMNEFCDKPLNSKELLLLMGEVEGEISGSIHYDNVAPCYLGGLQLILEDSKIISQTIPNFKNWFWIVAWPGTKVPTAEARDILPKKYKKETCIKNSRYLAGFIHASYSQQPHLAARLMQDFIAEPYRIKLLPNYLYVKEKIKKIGAISSGISGSGPTIFSISDNINTAQKISAWLTENYLQNTTGFVHICFLDSKGVRKIG
ncbi:homoserine kinase [Buchnera aphidicola]|uniref:Homoserine kinase n=2 Tax=Buchnera aphidicola TaxID=9 RepID=KHSE_BUCA5|nr:homoserine kinase [Buchnera aphidicola]B8D797.1 RecName: Full=Homoserine kinase; Short=HK; Short=HSK [Buchnera aphidicola str. Tuc7 (Acyrthosiphon pisum)]B8D8Z2.1 RecName: Full=Homoserine kinase; Short=HK; Short=HSK [Buchnera aphidicola str. 5A (Acyrthosiphon pisum)]ADP66588.1 homoserine kinase [Buchnera aphidicola str. TLW03 (Acyrthosiphon pisum)]ACL30012.1 homoserine kinase [Buchnera aphidicola str. Tuc7 (Acyrthosiphon pisum)]ACL30563.1 homoserine kinase [Buchnera aphidicola str. 5A (Acyr